MNRRGYFASFLMLCAYPAVVLATTEATIAAQAATRDWLKKLDASDYLGTWEGAASMFKTAVSAQAWQQALQSVRAPLGAVRSRTDKSATFTRSLPGVPDGQYVVIQFDTTFENKAKTVETVTVALDRDGAWRVAGYFIK